MRRGRSLFAPSEGHPALFCCVDFIGIEPDEHYLDVAIARTKAALAPPAGKKKPGIR
jgi:hypothetical protein